MGDKEQLKLWLSKNSLLGIHIEVKEEDGEVYLVKYRSEARQHFIDIPEYISIDTIHNAFIFSNLHGDVELHIHGKTYGAWGNQFSEDITSIKLTIDSQHHIVSTSDGKTILTNNLVGMFSGCKDLKRADISIDCCISMASGMFFDCISLEEVRLRFSRFGECASMVEMFEGCINLKAVDFGDKLDVSGVKYASNMFKGCKALTNLDIGSWYLRNVSRTISMFEGCENLEVLDLSKWVMPKNESLKRMFRGCKKLKYIDLGSMSKLCEVSLVDIDGIIDDCVSLEAIRIGSGCIKTHCGDSFGNKNLKYVYGFKQINFYKNLSTDRVYYSDLERAKVVHMLYKSMDSIFNI